MRTPGLSNPCDSAAEGLREWGSVTPCGRSRTSSNPLNSPAAWNARRLVPSCSSVECRQGFGREGRPLGRNGSADHDTAVRCGDRRARPDHARLKPATGGWSVGHAGGNADARDYGGADQRRDHDLEVGRPISRKNRGVVHDALLDTQAFPALSCNGLEIGSLAQEPSLMPTTLDPSSLCRVLVLYAGL